MAPTGRARRMTPAAVEALFQDNGDALAGLAPQEAALFVVLPERVADELDRSLEPEAPSAPEIWSLDPPELLVAIGRETTVSRSRER
ncbi:hypothetical protein [Rhizosaccharibacter radicis]|uniref:Uncharacterized protein n=1 Tax=Rhizosaccharibacter radicis TaxID=2782605 RepID=A0ABT1W0V7_9PROT|nr:hypothetical protein [Acetobacteraceae bacterium KSS12]